MQSPWACLSGLCAGHLVLIALALLLALVVAGMLIRPLGRLLVAAVIGLHYRARLAGAAHLRGAGPLVLAANHHSWLDAFVLMAALPGRVQFLMDRAEYDHPLVRPFALLAGAVPVSFDGEQSAAERSFEAARRAMERGQSVVVFPEGTVSPFGALMPFRADYRRIAERAGVKVAPVHIDGMWGSALSYYGGKLFFRRPSLARRVVVVRVGAPMVASTEPWKLRQAVEELAAETLTREPQGVRSLGLAFVRSARAHWRRQAFADTTGKQTTYGTTLIGALVLSRVFASRMPQPMVGVALPSTVGAALANLGLVLAGKVAVNLNFTSSRQALESACRQCGLETTITSRKFMEKMPGLELPRPLVYLEDLAAGVTRGDKVRALLRALFAPARALAPGKGGDETATVIFSSGTTSEPKGVVLSHNNVLGNVESMHRAIVLTHRDTLAAALPFFHSFGYTVTLWFALLEGFRACYHPSPLEGEAIARLVRDNKATLLLATPTFLRTYIRKATPEDFASLRIIITGAEKLAPDLARRFREHFGKGLLEGYGTTEMTPVAALNVDDVTRGGRTLVGNKLGTIGRPLPGVTAKIVDPDTWQERTPGQSGMLMMKGPNVMRGYLNKPDATAEVVREGWYVTGDIGSIDEDGFITLTDRLSRFSKIGGEMVPHGAVEEALTAALGASEPVLAVTAVNDEAKGERLVVLYTPDAGSEEKVKAAALAAKLPNLWRPAPEAFIPVPEIPTMATGKTDLRGLKSLAHAAFRTRGRAT